MRFVPVLLIAAMLSISACPAGHAGIQDNVRTATRVFLEKMGEGRFDRLDEIYAPSFVAHGASRDYDLEQDNQSARSWRTALPDLQVAVQRTVANKDFVAVHWRATGTNSVAAEGMPGNGAKLSVEGMTFFRFLSGRIIEEWSVIDIAEMRRQLSKTKAP